MKAWLLICMVYLDAVNQSVSVDQNLVQYAYRNESISPPNLIDPELYEIANLILQRMIGIDRKHINVKNCLHIFVFLVSCFS